MLVAASLAYDSNRADQAGSICHGTLKISNSTVQTGWYTFDLTHRATGIGYVAICQG